MWQQNFELRFWKTNATRYNEITFHNTNTYDLFKLLYEKTNTLCYNEVPFLKKLTIYAITKLLSGITNDLCLIKVTFWKKNLALHTLWK